MSGRLGAPSAVFSSARCRSTRTAVRPLRTSCESDTANSPAAASACRFDSSLSVRCRLSVMLLNAAATRADFARRRAHRPGGTRSPLATASAATASRSSDAVSRVVSTRAQHERQQGDDRQRDHAGTRNSLERLDVGRERRRENQIDLGIRKRAMDGNPVAVRRREAVLAEQRVGREGREQGRAGGALHPLQSGAIRQADRGVDRHQRSERDAARPLRRVESGRCQLSSRSGGAPSWSDRWRQGRRADPGRPWCPRMARPSVSTGGAGDDQRTAPRRIPILEGWNRLRHAGEELPEVLGIVGRHCQNRRRRALATRPRSSPGARDRRAGSSTDRLTPAEILSSDLSSSERRSSSPALHDGLSQPDADERQRHDRRAEDDEQEACAE